MAELIARILIFIFLAYAALGYGVPRLVRRGWKLQSAQMVVAVVVIIALFVLNYVLTQVG